MYAPDLYTGDSQRPPASDVTSRRPGDVEILAHHQLGAQLVPHRSDRGRGARQQPVGPGEGEVAHQHGDALAVAASVAPPAGPTMLSVEPTVHRRATASRSPSRPSRRRGATRKRGAAPSRPPRRATTDARETLRRRGTHRCKRSAAAACRPEERTRLSNPAGSPSQGSTAAHRARSSARTSRSWASTSAVMARRPSQRSRERRLARFVFSTKLGGMQADHPEATRLLIAVRHWNPPCATSPAALPRVDRFDASQHRGRLVPPRPPPLRPSRPVGGLPRARSGGTAVRLGPRPAPPGRARPASPSSPAASSGCGTPSAGKLVVRRGRPAVEVVGCGPRMRRPTPCSSAPTSAPTAPAGTGKWPRRCAATGGTS